MWKDIPVPFFLSAYFFEVLNPDQVLKGAKPVLSQRGPYVYRSGTTCVQLGMSLSTVLPARLLAGSSGRRTWHQQAW